jgi:hypothetical protein
LERFDISQILRVDRFESAFLGDVVAVVVYVEASPAGGDSMSF